MFETDEYFDDTDFLLFNERRDDRDDTEAHDLPVDFLDVEVRWEDDDLCDRTEDCDVFLSIRSKPPPLLDEVDDLIDA